MPYMESVSKLPYFFLFYIVHSTHTIETKLIKLPLIHLPNIWLSLYLSASLKIQVCLKLADATIDQHLLSENVLIQNGTYFMVLI